MNTFKFGSIVSGEYFTDRKNELQTIKGKLDSENHLILISPRRYGKSSLIRKCLDEINCPFIWLDLQYILSVQEFATQLLKSLLSVYTYERVKYEISHFRIIPTFSTNPISNDWQVSFQTSADTSVLLEDVMSLLQHVSTPQKRLIVVLDEFQEVKNIGTHLDSQLRSLMQNQQGINYIFLGSQESMMEEIFERKKSPFYHFGQLMHLDKIPYDDFFRFIFDRLPSIRFKEDIVRRILDFTSCHPYYTQQLCAQVWENIVYKQQQENVVEHSISDITQSHDLDYERLWNSLNRTDRGIILQISRSENPLQNRDIATSTTFSGIKRLQKNGFVIRTAKAYELEDPFFNRWLSEQ